MSYDKYRDVAFNTEDESVSGHEADLRHWLCFGHDHGPKTRTEHDFRNPETLNKEDLIKDLKGYIEHHNLSPLQIRAIAFWTGFKCSRYYNCQHNLVADLLTTLV